jgi:hypothetical protein
MTKSSIKTIQIAASRQHQALMKIAFPFHNLHITIVQMAISSIPDSDLVMPADHSEIA